MSTPPPQAPSAALDPIEREAIARVQKLLSHEATPEDIETNKRWRARSPAHDAAFIAAQQVWDKVGAAGRALLDPDEDFTTELDAIGRRRKAINRRALLGGGGAAVLATVAAYGAVKPRLGLWPSLSELAADYHTRTGEQRNVTFAGHVTINLNTQTSLAIRSVQGSEDRIELIAGEASFTASTSMARSLVVLAAAGKAMTESGRFDIRHIAGGERSPVSVTCFEGRVRVEHGPAVRELQPGQRLRYDAAGLSQTISVDPVVASEWQRGIVEFRGTPLSEAIEEINRYRPGRIILTNPTLGQKQLSGRFRIDQMNDVLLQLERAFSAKLQRFPGGIVLLS